MKKRKIFIHDVYIAYAFWSFKYFILYVFLVYSETFHCKQSLSTYFKGKRSTNATIGFDLCFYDFCLTGPFKYKIEQHHKDERQRAQNMLHSPEPGISLISIFPTEWRKRAPREREPRKDTDRGRESKTSI